MRNSNTSPQVLADKLRMPMERMHRLLGLVEFDAIIERGGDDRRIRLNERQALIVFLTGDLVRFNVKGPLAATTALPIAEALAFNPDAETVNIEFRENGASFTFTGDDAPEAAVAAGAARFRLTFHLNAYRAAVSAAIGGSDAV